MTDGAAAVRLRARGDTFADAFTDQTERLMCAKQLIARLIAEKAALHKRCNRQQEQIRGLMGVVDDGE